MRVFRTSKSLMVRGSCVGPLYAQALDGGTEPWIWRRGRPLRASCALAAFVRPCTAGFFPFVFESAFTIFLSRGPEGPLDKKMAEREGFEPPWGLRPHLISSQRRYDRFGTSPGARKLTRVYQMKQPRRTRPRDSGTT